MGCKAVIDFVSSNCGKTLFVVDDEEAKKNTDPSCRKPNILKVFDVQTKVNLFNFKSEKD